MKKRTSDLKTLLTGIGGLDRFTRVVRRFKFIPCLAILLFLGVQTVGKAAPLTASVVFHASTDNAIVVSYFLEVFANGSDPTTASPIVSSDLGKPGVDANGDITVDRSTLFNALAPGTYLVTVSSIGPGGPGRGAPVTFSRPADVPNVVGLTQPAGTSAITAAGLAVGAVTTAPSATVAPGLIISESPAAGTSVPAGSAVNLVVSSGTATPPTVTSLTPTAGAVGTTVTIAGSSFGTTPGIVRFNGTTASTTSWNSTSIVASVPGGATTGPVVVTVGGVASNGVTFTVSTSPALPAPWTTQDIGNPAVTGQATHASGTFSVTGAGLDIWDTTDQFRFVYQTLDGDGEIVARVASLQNTDGWAKAGVMIREDLTGNAPNAFVMVTPANGMSFQRRGTRGGSTAATSAAFWTIAPQWVRLVRAGTTLSASYSQDGTAWTAMGTATMTFPTRVYVGLAVTSHSAPAATTAAFSNVIVGGSTPTNQAPTLTQPANQSQGEGSSASLQLAASDPDGNPLAYSATGLPASLSVNASSGLISGPLTFTSAGTYTVTATASDGALSNSKTFTWTVTNTNQGPTLTQPANQNSAEGSSPSLQLAASDPDGTPVTFSTTGLPASLSVNASSGMISGTLNFTSAGTYNVTATASDGTMSNSKTVTWTVTDVSQAPSITTLSPASGPAGTSVTISGANFGTTPGIVRFNGVSATSSSSWTNTSIVTTVPSAATTGAVVVTVGGVDSNAVTFTVSAAGTLPAPWLSQDVGNPALAGQATHASGTFSVNGAGLDIWDTTDQFRFVYQTLDGDGEIVARVGGLQNTNGWAKAGVMIREDLTGNAPNAFVMVTPANGMSFQRRGTRGGSTTATTAAFWTIAPQWVRLVRAGTTLSASYSPDGTAWTLIGTATMTFPTRVYVGLAVTSHNASAATTATVSNVTTTGAVGGQSQGMVVSSVMTPATGDSVTLSASGSQVTAENANIVAKPVNRSSVGNDYDGDGKADISAYRPSTGEWQILDSRTNYSTRRVTRWGTADDVLVPGDYDGDGRTDLAYYRPSTGTWSILASGTNDNPEKAGAFQWGLPGDLPVTGDFDGDGKTDLTVFRPSNGTWAIRYSSIGYSIANAGAFQWGLPGDLPVVGDFDGDGKTELTVFRPSTGTWHVRYSSLDYSLATAGAFQLGIAGDLPVAGDFDGDGKTDLTVFRPSNGTWYVRYSSLGYSPLTTGAFQWGLQGDLPMAADFDGDGKTELAVFRPSDASWYIRYSSLDYKADESVAFQGGLLGDVVIK